MSTQQGMRDRLRYTPGDGYVYTWSGGPWIEVHRIVSADPWVTEPQTEVIAAPESTTGENLMTAVDRWRAR